MSSPQLETFLARLYTDTQLREAFLIDPHPVANAANLTADEVDAMCKIDRIGLQMASASIASKREVYQGKRKSRFKTLSNLFARWRRK